MSNTRKDGDFNLDEELRNKIAADEAGQPFSDDHEDVSELELEVNEQFASIENKYGINGENLAQNILTPLIQTTGLVNRGLKNSPKIVVLRETLMPAVLVECAFVSNPVDRKLLTDKKALDDMGYAIASGIMETISQCK